MRATFIQSKKDAHLFSVVDDISHIVVRVEYTTIRCQQAHCSPYCCPVLTITCLRYISTTQMTM